MRPEIPDQELLERLRTGNQTAAAALADRYLSPLTRFAARMLSDLAGAEDVAQEALSKLSTAATLPSGPLKPWLYRIVRNRCLDILRREHRSPTAARLASGYDPAATASGVATRAARNERDEQIRAVIAGLPDEYREVVLLKYFENLSREEIAAVLDLSDAAVKGRLARGLQELRQRLRAFEGSGA